MSDDFQACATCGVERAVDTLDGKGMCPFCVEEGREPPAKYAEIIVKERKKPDPPPEDRPRTPKASTPEKQAEVDEAFRMSYTPPSFDRAAAEASPQREMALRTLARRRFLPFVQRFRPKYMAGWVHEDICRRLERFVEDVAAGREPRLLLMCPPRSGKSELGSRHLPAWVLGQHPDWEIIAASHTSSLTLSFSRYIRDLIRDPAYQVLFPEMRLDPSSQSVENWNTLSGGGYLAAGVGTGITGRGCLAPYTLVDTSRGKIRIVDLKVGDSVYGYDHRRQEVIETCVKAIQVTERSTALLNCGDIHLTADHRIYNTSKGDYTRASAAPHLLGLRREEGATRCRLQEVLFRPAEGRRHSAHMRLLWEELRAQRGGASEVEGPPRRECQGVLQQGVLRHVQGQQPCSVQQGKGRMSALQEASNRDGSLEILQQGVLQRVPGFETTDGCVYWGIPGAEKTGLATGQEVLAVRFDARALRGPSHQPGRNGQPDFESGTAVCGVPPQISPVHGACAADIAKLFEPFDFVVDIQTETGNFFVGHQSVLVHNCHILLLDDLVKDIEAADSPTIRENTWEWYISTAYTRLAPGGGVLGIMCMTGDTPVMMADGTTRRLDTLTQSDVIATYACGLLATSRVAAVRSSGRDFVFKITMKSGKIVRANQRHPFLTVAPSGELSWTRLRNLTTALRIVTVKGSGANGAVSSVLPRGAKNLPSAVASAIATTERSAGQTDTAQGPTTTRRGATPASNIATASRQPTTTGCTPSKAGGAPSAGRQPALGIHRGIGRTNSPSTTVTRQVRSEGCSATAATQESDTLVMSRWHYPPRGISDFTLDEIVSIEYDGEEEVFDVQVDTTENFIANGLVSHNTWWNESDWAGKIQQVMKSGEGDKFEIIRYPAINEEGDEYLLPDDQIIQILPGSTVPVGAKMTRPKGTAIHPERYSTQAMTRIKNNLVAAGQKRIWNALYQQNPTPDDGVYFTKEMYRYYVHAPQRRNMTIYQAWDFAITEETQNDYTVCATIGQDEYDNLYVLHIMRFRSNDGNAIVEHMIDQYVAYEVDFLGVEDGQIWKTLRSQFERRCQERRVYPSFEVLQPLTDKLVRANPLKGRMQLGKVFFLKGADWEAACNRELMVFPAGKHDDQVDALAWATRLTLNHAPPKPPAPPPQKSWKDKLKGLTNGKGTSHMAA